MFDLLYGANLNEAGQDTLSGYNVNTIGLQLPKDALAAKGNADGNPVIGVWSTTQRKGATCSPPLKARPRATATSRCPASGTRS